MMAMAMKIDAMTMATAMLPLRSSLGNRLQG
jgi:hypothetical protein